MSVPTPPQVNPLPRVGPTTIEVWWDPPLSDGGDPILNYTLSCISPAITYTVGASQNTYWVQGLTTGVSYAFTLRANNTNGASAAVDFIVVTCGNFPSAPQNVSTLVNEISSGFVQVTWDAPVSDGGAALKYYAVEAHGQYPDYVSSYSYGTPVGQTQVLCSNLTPNQNYNFIVNSINDPGWSLLPSTTGSLFFSPSNVLSDVFLWFDAASPTSYTLDGTYNTVTTWNSKTPNGYFLSSSGPTEAPSVSQSEFGIFPGFLYVPVEPRIVSYNTSIPSLKTNGQFLTFTVVRQLSIGNQGIWSSYYPTYPIGFTMYWNADNQFEYYVNGTNIVVNPSTILTNTIVTCAYETNEIGGASTIGITFNGNEFISTTNLNGPPVGDSGLVLGNFGTYDSQPLFAVPDNGLIAEHIVIANDPSQETRQKIEGYLAWKYNMVSELPPTHPYYTSPPLP
jgi:hypothetical protein